MDFAKIAPYLQDPLVLIGFFVFISFLSLRAILKAGVLPQLSQASGYRILRSILLYGFILGLALTILGFGLKYRELSRQEQQHAVLLLKQELDGNLKVLAELEANTETIMRAAGTVQSVLRTPGLKIMVALFPERNADPAAASSAASGLAETVLTDAAKAGLLDNRLEKQKFAAAAQAISGTIERTMPTIKSLGDLDRTRYRFTEAVWTSQLPILRKIDIIDVTEFQRSYQDLDVVRANYDVVVARCMDYLGAIRTFLTPDDGKITQPRLAAVLAAERLYIEIVAAYSKRLLENMQDLKSLADRMASTG
jgi:hypothetical protein